MKINNQNSFRHQIVLCLAYFLILTACNAQKEDVYNKYGSDFEMTEIIAADNLLTKYENIPLSDSLDVTIRAEVNSVCKAKGCWMKLDMTDEEEVMVKFKDYSFFVPKDIEGKEVVVHGKAFVNLVSVEEQRHYAKDAGKSEEEIAAITQPKKTFSFEATGVKIKE